MEENEVEKVEDGGEGGGRSGSETLDWTEPGLEAMRNWEGAPTEGLAGGQAGLLRVQVLNW